MLIVYYIMWAIIVVLLFMLINANNLNLADENKNLQIAIDTQNFSQIDVINGFIDLGNQTKQILLVQLILQFVSVVVVTTAPLVQSALKKLKFKKVDSYE